MTVLAATVIAALAVAGCAVLVAAAARTAAHTAAVAADMAALSGAGALWQGIAPCAVATTIAADNGARLTGCTVTVGGDVTVTVTVGHMPATATAGPA
ncbi:helicase/secretion neighborhood TadE-like protein [Corynebacterium sp. CCM 8862]|uniref:Helicase/secretion neighborhood TadE-like protein n=3 Tax=Corynebacterium mendelii TaxID=2765362 RepID=A0A939IV24_9CORY|nr:Rv3654c family TadE-like protein [Corynebacterium mendelii]MBN9643791.1 helicase/secretion neighborhood TadE-like protein [Corynebacterium mendelii]